MKIVVGLLGLLLVGACSKSLLHRDSDKILTSTLYRTQYSQISTHRAVAVRDEATWERLWEEMAKNGALESRPLVDFSQDMVLAVILGERPNGCYSVSIGTIRATAEKLVAEFSETRPMAGDFCTYSFTSPAHFVVISRDSRPVEFLRVDG